ncbi:hypothetical protein PGT21_030763 [Puccinia graminis f. sp. tritici]|uniref:RING-type domain-containing protein n=1 Tax=Puccinia graminis f. sp. tritici TaxID=56615 RepID=A0A5B0M7T4_PUCGR|nr:hypothetical protein PGT21_030763 [Puccinia graminis f. sp. tritici]KAA1078549.1 hypothetical protein PGTUg99_011694 [Puccinia graminis f. sp. tritici]
MFSWLFFIVLIQKNSGMESPGKSIQLVSLQPVTHSVESNNVACITDRCNVGIEAPMRCSSIRKDPTLSSNGLEYDSAQKEHHPVLSISMNEDGVEGSSHSRKPTRISDIKIPSNSAQHIEKCLSNHENIMENSAVESKKGIERPVNEAQGGQAEHCINIEAQTEVADCAICLSAIEIQETYRIVDCKHPFHKACITESLIKNPDHPSCPLCRGDASKDLEIMRRIWREEEVHKTRELSEMESILCDYVTCGGLRKYAIPFWALGIFLGFVWIWSMFHRY